MKDDKSKAGAKKGKAAAAGKKGGKPEDDKKQKVVTEPMILDYKEYHTENTVHFVIKMSPDQMAKAEAIGLEKFFKVALMFAVFARAREGIYRGSIAIAILPGPARNSNDKYSRRNFLARS